MWNDLVKLYDVLKHHDDMPPLNHIDLNAHINIKIDLKGNFLSAEIINDRILVQCTQKSASRTSGKVAHGLSDKLMYIENEPIYLTQLKKWTDFSQSKILNSIVLYLAKNRVANDLVANDLTSLDWSKLPKVIKRDHALVCWTVDGVNTWEAKHIQQSWIDYIESIPVKKELCIVTGEMLEPTNSHPTTIRNKGDKTRLISANDDYGFTYRGRYTDKSDLAKVGYITTQKMHNSLRWLIKHRGQVFNGLVFVAWAESGDPLPRIDSCDIIDDDNQNPHEKVTVIAVDSAMDNLMGRLAIVYQHHTTRQNFFNSVKKWNSDFAVEMREKIHVDGIYKFKYRERCPTIREIVDCIYGDIIDGCPYLLKNTATSIINCILHGKNIPYDFVSKGYKNSIKPQSERWIMHRNIAVAAALYSGYKIRET